MTIVNQLLAMNIKSTSFKVFKMNSLHTHTLPFYVTISTLDIEIFHIITNTFISLK
jgi:hypothetical protein